MFDKTVSILGCGWLGLPLAQHLVELNYKVKGSTTTIEKCAILESSKIAPYQLVANPTLTGDKIDEFFSVKTLFLNIPFRRNLEDPKYYQQQIDSIIPYIESSTIEFVIFASSTSVYPASIKRAVEDEPLTPDNPRAKTLQSIEQSLMNNSNFQTTVIRFAGMYGNNRRIGQILAGRTGLNDGKSPVNLIHLDDCVAISAQIIEKNICNCILNACNDGHPTRKDLYTKAALHYKLVVPQFTEQPPTRLKVVSNANLKRILQYSFIHPDPMFF